MTTFLLIRHAEHATQSTTMAGRTPGVHLSAQGRRQAEALAQRLEKLPIAALYSSPIERALDTANALSGRIGLPVEIREGMTEVDVGEWAGRELADLAQDPHWIKWNRFRSAAQIPGGETMCQAQARIVAELIALREKHPDGAIACVSHGDPIRAALCCFLGIPLDLALRLEIGLASVSVLRLDEQDCRVLWVNSTGTIRLD
jgi:probable phosphoglycerate mutase